MKSSNRERIDRRALAYALQLSSRTLSTAYQSYGFGHPLYDDDGGHATFPLHKIAIVLNADPQWLKAIVAKQDSALTSSQAAMIMEMEPAQFQAFWSTSGIPAAAARLTHGHTVRFSKNAVSSGVSDFAKARALLIGRAA